MNQSKMIIIVRKDLNLRKGKFASQIANATLQFVIENNESQRRDELHVKMSPEETLWLYESMPRAIALIDTEEALKDLILKAEFHSIPVYPVYDTQVTPEKEKTLTCAAFGPIEGDDLSSILGKLKTVP
jgi:PTH2 family peptidyl-tRNA hydrolase